MEVEYILTNIFGSETNIEFNIPSSTKSDGHSRILQSLNVVKEVISSTLQEISKSEELEDTRPGRLGPKIVHFDILSHHGLTIVSPDRLSVNSQSNFSTLRANTCLYGGKWMYELQLGSKGVMQVGWGTLQCKFSQECGVGDTVNSYSYDGNRVRKWNVSTNKYGEPWLSGDIIGCALDMDNGTIDFYRNGRHLGRAFENITVGTGIAYFPTVSLAFTENLTANFGATPLRYPIEGYQTLQLTPRGRVSKANILFKWLENVINLLESSDYGFIVAEKSMNARTYLMCIVRLIMSELAPLLVVPYVVEAVFLPFFQRLIENSSKDINTKVNIFLDILWTFLEDHEMKICLENTVVYLLSAFRHVSLLLEYPDQCKSLIILTNLCRHSTTRQYLLQNILFDRVRFANFIHVKPLDEGGLAEIIQKTWWETNPIDSSVEVNRDSYIKSCERIKAAISEIETLQVDLLITLLNNADGTSKKPSSRSIFLKKFRRFVQENLLSNRTPLQITVCCFHRLLVAFRILWDAEVGTKPIHIPCKLFYDASINYNGIDRLGGVLSYLNKTYKNELIYKLGSNHEVILAMNQTQESTSTFMGGPGHMNELPMLIPTSTRMLNTNPTTPLSPLVFGYSSYLQEDKIPIRLGTADSVLSLLELLDGIILFYHAAAKKQIAKVANLRDSMSEYISAMSDVKARLEVVKKVKDKDSNTDSIQEELIRTMEVFNSKLSEQARHMAWVRAAVYSEEKQAQLAWLLKVVILTLRKASEEGNMFRFVPYFYLEALADLCSGLKNHLHPTVPIQKILGYQDMLKEIAQFLCDHFLDARIVHAIAKDTLILTIAGFTSNSLTLQALEQIPKESRLQLVRNILRPYENRAWAQSNWVLVRFWQGNGFAFRYDKSPHLSKKVGPKMLQQESISQPIKPCPSTIYQMHVKELLLAHPRTTLQFLNSLLNQMNWAFSEFIGMVQEIYNVSSRPERVFIESRQLKVCATCFDLAISLLRVVEMITTVAPSIFNNPQQISSGNLLSRLCQLLCQILNRISSQTSCFQHVVLLDIPDLDAVDHFPILTAVVGILLALLKEDMENATKSVDLVPNVTRILLTEPSFQMNSLHFVLGEGPTKNGKIKNVKPFSLENYKDAVSEREIKSVREMITYLDKKRTLLPDNRIISDDDDTCTICYAYSVAAIFKPCNHQSCRVCIDRHLLNNRECFFCKSIIVQVYDLEGAILHDFTTSLIPSSSSTTS
ncbi:E3 ubiquitin-protein ligase RNF123-like [Chelonus insularis]|uniref:E3 ubiquitin-protein ligase RNF123-like n=1 Tax=Chelonus insularis TaxID=460826 RepID=UPI00158A7CAA|nr:E3 ubiquitin-protein ligase RNF123-like [Chelonus insularis]